MADLGGYCCASTNTIYNTGNPVADKAACQAACTVHTDMASCDGICHTAVCDTKPECCLHADLKIGYSIEDISLDGPVIVSINQPIYINARNYSYNCRDMSNTGIARYEIKVDKDLDLNNICDAPTWANPLNNITYGCTENLVLGLNSCTGWFITDALQIISNPLIGLTIKRLKESMCGEGILLQFSQQGTYSVRLWIYDHKCERRSYPDLLQIVVE